MPRLNRIIETALYVDDLERARTFYETKLGLEPLLTELSVRLTRGGAVRRLEDIAVARRRLAGNGNPVLVFEALFCSLIASQG